MPTKNQKRKLRLEFIAWAVLMIFLASLIIGANEVGLFDRGRASEPAVRTDGSWSIYKSPKTGFCYEVLTIGSGNGLHGGMALVACP